MSLLDLRVADLLRAFSSPRPTPGGGSAAALAGALGASLLAMVAGMPKTRTGAGEERAALDGARAALLTQQAALMALVDRDADAYDAVVAAFRLPKSTDDEKRARQAAIEAAMRAATDAPLETIRSCVALAPLARTVAEHGNPAAKSDVMVGLSLAMAGWSGGVANVTVNLEHATDAVYIAAVKAELAQLRQRVGVEIAPTYAALGITGHD